MINIRMHKIRIPSRDSGLAEGVPNAVSKFHGTLQGVSLPRIPLGFPFAHKVLKPLEDAPHSRSLQGAHLCTVQSVSRPCLNIKFWAFKMQDFKRKELSIDFLLVHTFQWHRSGCAKIPRKAFCPIGMSFQLVRCSCCLLEPCSYFLGRHSQIGEFYCIVLGWSIFMQIARRHSSIQICTTVSDMPFTVLFSMLNLILPTCLSTYKPTFLAGGSVDSLP